MAGGESACMAYTYKVVEDAAQGWQLKSITSASVYGRVGPGGVEGLLVTFEAQVG
jgi:Domain of unknown function (DUF4177)